MRNVHNWTPEEITYVRHAFEDGATWREMAKHLGLAPHQVAYRARSVLGLVINEQNPLSEDEILTARVARSRGIGWVALAAMMQRSENTLRRYRDQIESGMPVVGAPTLPKKRKVRKKRADWTHYSADDDAALRKLYSEYVGVEEIAKRLGRTVGSVRQKIHKFGLRRDAHVSILVQRCGMTVEQAKAEARTPTRIAMDERQKLQHSLKAEKVKMATSAIRQMMDEISANPAARTSAVRRAWLAGARLEQIADCLGVSRQRAHQIVHGIQPGHYVKGEASHANQIGSDSSD